MHCLLTSHVSHKLKTELLHLTNIYFQWLLKLIPTSSSSYILFRISFINLLYARFRIQCGALIRKKSQNLLLQIWNKKCLMKIKVFKVSNYVVHGYPILLLFMFINSLIFGCKIKCTIHQIKEHSSRWHPVQPVLLLKTAPSSWTVPTSHFVTALKCLDHFQLVSPKLRAGILCKLKGFDHKNITIALIFHLDAFFILFDMGTAT